MSTDWCAVCKYWKTLKKTGPLYLCKKNGHLKRYIWDVENQYYRQKKWGGKWKNIWPTQASLARALEKLGYKVDQEVMPIWSESKKGVLMPFDMAIPELKVLIEYQGEQHEKRIKPWFRTKARWITYVNRQKFKQNLAKQNGWVIVEFRPEDKPFKGALIVERLREAQEEHDGKADKTA